MPLKLSPAAEKTIQEYLSLPFADLPAETSAQAGVAGVRCPYFNNARLRQRGQLKVLIGKGEPTEIVEEAKVISVQYCKGIFDRNGLCDVHIDHPAEHERVECVRQFLIDNNLGVDCSGFATNVLRQHFRETKKFDLAKKLFITSKKNILRWLISRLRPVEQISVRVYAHDKNTETITELAKIQPADVIVMLQTGPNKNRDHILLITEIDGSKIKYAHARAWFSEGKYGHGVSTGEITVTDPNKGLLEQVWEEKNKIVEENETYLEAKRATVLEIRRIKIS